MKPRTERARWHSHVVRVLALASGLVASAVLPACADAASESLEGCVCGISKSTNTVTILPWMKDKESWDAKNPQVFSYEPDAKIVKAEFSVGISGPPERKLNFEDKAKDVPSLEGRRAIVKWVQKAGKRYATQFQLTTGKPWADVAAMIGTGGPDEASMRRMMELCVTCPCQHGSLGKR